MMTRKDDPGADDEALQIAAKEGVPVESTADISSDTLAVYEGDEPVNPADATEVPPAGRYAQAPEPEATETAPAPKSQGRGRHRRK